MEIYTRQLEPAEIFPQFAVAAALALRLGHERLEISYGWGCQLDIDELWQAHTVPTAELDSFVHESLSRGIYVLAESDLFVRPPGREFEFQFCHEADIHFRASDRALVEQVSAEWAAADLAPNVHPESNA